eukprot:7086041-Lingulodinium_polyedra.AAC.1
MVATKHSKTPPPGTNGPTLTRNAPGAKQFAPWPRRGSRRTGPPTPEANGRYDLADHDKQNT